MRPPLGSPGGPVPAPKSSMGFVMPIYTICIIVFFVYTLTKIMFRRQSSPYDHIAPDPQFRRRVFRDDSRTSPEKLVVTAISGLVAEVQQQMEAGGAPNQLRQEAQDNARPYTNGTILLNSGPVQIVTSEYKETSKEKTPEPVFEKESTPEPKESEVTKVVTEPTYKEDESIVGSKESLPEVKQSSPEPSVTQEESDTTSEIVVATKSSPELADGKSCKELPPDPELPQEATSETVVVTKSSPEVLDTETSKEFPPDFEAPKVSHETTSDTVVVMKPSPAVTEDCKESPSEIPILEPISNLPLSPLTTESIDEFISDPITALDDSKDTKSEPEVSQVPDEKSNLNLIEDIPMSEISEDIELISESKESSSELKESSPSLDAPLPKTSESDILSSVDTDLEGPKTPEPKEPIPEPKESLPETEKSTSDSELLSLDSQNLINKPLPDVEESLSLLKESPKSEELLPDSKESSLDPKEPIEPNDLSLNILPSTIEPQEISVEPETSTVQPKELPIESKEPLISISDTKEPPELEDTEFNASSTNIKEPITSTADMNQSISEHKESSTQKESTPELTENSQDAKAPIVECSRDIEHTEHSPDIEAPIVERSPELEIIDDSSKIEAPVVEHKLESEITEQSSEIESESLRLKELTPQSKETTPERKLTGESKTIQLGENVSVPEGALLDLEEAIADVDDSTEKQKEKDPVEKVESNFQDNEYNDFQDNDTKAVKDIKDDQAAASDEFLQGERFVVKRSTPDVIEENKKLHPTESKPTDNYKLITEADEEDLENAAVKVVGMELTAHPADGGQWPRDQRPPPASPAPPRAPAAEAVQSIFLETEIPQQSRVLVANFQEDRPPPAAHAPLVVSGKMTLSLIQDAPRDTPERDPESTVDEFTTASAVTQPAAEKGEIESEEEIDEEIEVEEIELEEEEEEDSEEEEPPPPTKRVNK